VLGGTTVAGDVVLQTSPVVKERETVMGLVTEVNMTDMLAVLEISSVEVIIVNSLAIIITRKMTAVRDQLTSRHQKLLATLSLTAFIQHSSDRLTEDAEVGTWMKVSAAHRRLPVPWEKETVNKMRTVGTTWFVEITIVNSSPHISTRKMTAVSSPPHPHPLSV